MASAAVARQRVTGDRPRPRLPVWLKAYAVAVPALAAACFLAWRAAWAGETAGEWPLAVLFTALTAVAVLFPLLVSSRYLLTLDTAALFAALLLLGPPLAMVVAAAGTLASNLALALRRKRDGWNVAFNTGQKALAVGLAGLVLYGLPPAPAPFPLHGLANALAVIVAGVVLYATTSLAVAVAAGLQRGQNPLAISVRVWRTGLPDATALLLTGLLSALLLQTHPWAAVVTVLLAAMVYVSLQRTLRHLAREQAARAELERAIAVRTEFLAAASHELCTPVTSMRGYVQLLLRQNARPSGLDPTLLQRGLRTMDEQCDKLNRLVTQLLDVSRLQSGSLVLDRQRTDLAQLARDVVGNMQPLAAPTLLVRAQRPVWAAIDALRMEQVLVNLIDNAAKYGVDDGPIEVEVAEDVDAETGRPVAACLAVRDRALPILPEERERVFERFQQVGGSRHAGGMGLGLYVSRQIVLAHGGTIAVEAPTEGGNRYVVTLPAAADTMDGDENEQPAREAHQLPGAVGRLAGGAPLVSEGRLGEGGLGSDAERGEAQGEQHRAEDAAPAGTRGG